jgi:hypothetical protein
MISSQNSSEPSKINMNYYNGATFQKYNLKNPGKAMFHEGAVNQSQVAAFL